MTPISSHLDYLEKRIDRWTRPTDKLSFHESKALVKTVRILLAACEFPINETKRLEIEKLKSRDGQEMDWLSDQITNIYTITIKARAAIAEAGEVMSGVD